MLTVNESDVIPCRRHGGVCVNRVDRVDQFGFGTHLESRTSPIYSITGNVSENIFTILNQNIIILNYVILNFLKVKKWLNFKMCFIYRVTFEAHLKQVCFK